MTSTLIRACVLTVFLPGLALAQGTTESGVPADVLADMEAEVGVWIADNAAYAGENEPWDEYGLEWTWGVGQRSLVGRLYGLADGVDAGTFWEFRQYWHPGDSVVVVQQYGSDGTFGTGALAEPEAGRFELVQDFYGPDGSVRQQRHVTEKSATERRGSSFSRGEDGSWTPGRTYVWIKQP